MTESVPLPLRLGAPELEAIHAHLARAYPEEGCGVLLGRDGEQGREVVEIIAFENRRGDSRHNRYLIAPEQFLASERRARERGLDVVGFFHSHPDHPAEPSRFDLEHAWPYYSYLIVSVRAGAPAESRSWRLSEQRARFEPEPLVTPAAAPRASGSDQPGGRS